MSDWSVSRNGGIDIDGEWRPADSWSAERRVYPGVAARVSVYGRQTTRGLSARRWHGELMIHGYSYGIGGGTCNSIKNALEKADKALTDSFVNTCLTRFYSSPFRVICVSKIENETAIPFMSYLGRYVKWMELPIGNYVEAHHNVWSGEGPAIHRSFVERFHLGYAGYGGSEIDAPVWR